MNFSCNLLFLKSIELSACGGFSSTLCISNGGQSANNETNMNKTNSSANMKVSAINPATTHTQNRWQPLITINKHQ